MASLELSLTPSGPSESALTKAEMQQPDAKAPLSTMWNDPPFPPSHAKRRKPSVADVVPNAKDTYHWLKYGEKLLRDRKTLRHYYRCGEKSEHGCNAKKMVDIVVTTGTCSVLYREDHNHSAPPPASAMARSLSKDAAGPLAKSSEAALDAATLARMPALFPLLSGSTDLATSAALAAALAAAAAAAATTAASSGSGDEQLLRSGMGHGVAGSLGGSQYEMLGHSRALDRASLLQPSTGLGLMPLGDLARTSSPTQTRSSPALHSAALASLAATASPAQASQHAQQQQLASSLAACLSLLSGETNQRAQGSAPGGMARDSLAGPSPLERLQTASSMAFSGDLSPSASSSSLLAARHLLQGAQQQQQEGAERAESWQSRRVQRGSPLPYALLRHALVASFQAGGGASKAAEHNSCSEGSYALPSPRAYAPPEAADSSGSAPPSLDAGARTARDSPRASLASRKAANALALLHEDASLGALKRKSPDAPLLEAASAGSDEEGSGESRLMHRANPHAKRTQAQEDLAFACCQGGSSCNWLAVGSGSKSCNCFC